MHSRRGGWTWPGWWRASETLWTQAPTSRTSHHPGSCPQSMLLHWRRSHCYHDFKLWCCSQGWDRKVKCVWAYKLYGTGWTVMCINDTTIMHPMSCMVLRMRRSFMTRSGLSWQNQPPSRITNQADKSCRSDLDQSPSDLHDQTSQPASGGCMETIS